MEHFEDGPVGGGGGGDVGEGSANPVVFDVVGGEFTAEGEIDVGVVGCGEDSWVGAEGIALELGAVADASGDGEIDGVEEGMVREES